MKLAFSISWDRKSKIIIKIKKEKTAWAFTMHVPGEKLNTID